MSNKTLSPAQQEKEKERKTRSRIRRKWHWGTFRHVLVIFLTFIAAIVAVLAQYSGIERGSMTIFQRSVRIRQRYANAAVSPDQRHEIRALSLPVGKRRPRA